jgi:hypothetical protein
VDVTLLSTTASTTPSAVTEVSLLRDEKLEMPRMADALYEAVAVTFEDVTVTRIQDALTFPALGPVGPSLKLTMPMPVTAEPATTEMLELSAVTVIPSATISVATIDAWLWTAKPRVATQPAPGFVALRVEDTAVRRAPVDNNLTSLVMVAPLSARRTL